MEAEEVAVFESDPFFGLHIALRRIDERAKSAEHTLSTLLWVEELLEKVVS